MATIEERIKDVKNQLRKIAKELWGFSPSTPEEEKKLDSAILRILSERIGFPIANEREESEGSASSDFLMKVLFMNFQLGFS